MNLVNYLEKTGTISSLEMTNTINVIEVPGMKEPAEMNKGDVYKIDIKKHTSKILRVEI
ncbi:MAG: hypothetical protein K8F91_20775 [Candidatus Obscuribacterales bacterium]|nr:hypothetical protein [Candidatus Obscuribacterales bacterium]